MNKTIFSVIVTLASGGASAQASWFCLAQDHEFSYEGNTGTRREAQKLALHACLRASGAPGHCYHHRCSGKDEPRRGNGQGGGLTYEQMRAVQDALDRQHADGQGWRYRRYGR